MTAARLSPRDLSLLLRDSAQLASQAALRAQLRAWTDPGLGAPKPDLEPDPNLGLDSETSPKSRDEPTHEVAALNSIDTYLSNAAMELYNQASLTSTRTKIAGVTIISVWTVMAAFAIALTTGRTLDPVILSTVLAITFGAGFSLAQVVLRLCYRVADRRTAHRLAAKPEPDQADLVEQLRSQIAALRAEIHPDEDDSHRRTGETISVVEAWLEFAGPAQATPKQ
ncbi:MAG: hypothetical protein ACRDT8_03555 [Micromonosporaceae bacterium]